MAVVMGQREARQAGIAVIVVAAANLLFGLLFLVVSATEAGRARPGLGGVGLITLVAGAVLLALGVFVRRGSSTATGVSLALFLLLLLATVVALFAAFALVSVVRLLVCAVVALLLVRALRSRPG